MRFRSFDDLRLVGIMHHTGLSREAAERAMELSGTEPLIRKDEKKRLADRLSGAFAQKTD